MSKRPRPSSEQDSNGLKRRIWSSDEEEKIGAPRIEDVDFRLWDASREGKSEVVKILLDAGSNVHADNDGVLRWASVEGLSELVKILLESGANVHADDDVCLLLASENGHAEVVKILLEAGADPFSIKERKSHKDINILLDEHTEKRLRMIPLPIDIANFVIRPFLSDF